MQVFVSWKLLFLQVLFHFLKVLHQADIHLLTFFNHHRLPFLDSFFISITNVATVVTYSVPILLLIFAYIKRRPLLQRKSWLVLITLTLDSTIADSVKNVVQRPRPFVSYPFINHLVTVHTSSFPSGHTAEVSLLAFSISLLFPAPKRLKTIAWLWAALVAYSRMYLGVHYPSDILGSLIISAVFGIAFIRLMIRLGFVKENKLQNELGQ